MAHCLRVAAMAIGVCCFADAALGQYSQPLFLEAARDPGPAESAVTARSLALGGVQTSSGLAEDAISSPATLLMAQGTDLVIAGGALRFARDELATTPRQLPPHDPARVTSSRSLTPLGSVAVATRARWWALAGFAAAATGYRHEFETAQAQLAFATVQGVGFFQRGKGSASTDLSVRRVGAALAATPWRDRLAVGVAVYGAQVDYHVAANAEVESWSNTYSDFTFRHRFTQVESDRVDLVGWRPGYVVNVLVRPARFLSLSGRWRHEAAFAGVRRLTVREVLVSGDPGSPRPGVERPIEFRLPRLFAVSGVVALPRTVLVTELAGIRYGEVFESPSEETSPFGCDNLTTIFCPGWGFSSHRTVDALTWRLGGERSVTLGRGTVQIRGGVTWEQAHTLARSSADPRRTGGSLPAPPIVDPFEPPREDVTWVSVGAGYAWRGFELAFGLAHAGHQTRLLADFRLRMP